ncbi:hypothetical protein EJ05DRAFT_483640 [Pseudovirgaria hyperparasitica]|uniref:Uncharacterized protein n=1 Tax=Pseudovirgaria hyperparasitica TaxID=470096 RepID=A0A6A6WGZ8_9PEZI|nr:uncharacterized protein EJ05DRAFT_483640 [Pseudovirgaria hyperparasitica]KAF2761256.1 hypothetical protein EJ05DRAFT_483640 [Pseudovirgaria hyperparasitica]
MSAQRRDQFSDLDSEMEEDDWDNFSLDRIRDENDRDDDSQNIDDDVSEADSSVEASSDDKEPTAKDLAFIVPDTCESSDEDNSSDDELDEKEEDAHVGYIKGDGTFVRLAGYEELMLKAFLTLRILRKHTVERTAQSNRRFVDFSIFS